MHIEQVVRLGEAGRCQQRLQFLGDQALELRTRVEVIDHAALRAHQVVMVVAGQGLGDLESIGAVGAAHANRDAGIAQLGKVSISRRQRHPGDLGDFLRSDWAI